MKRLSALAFTLAASTLLSASFNASAQTWKSLPSMKSVRFEASAVQYKDDIFVFNGFGRGIKIEPTVELFDAGTKNWSRIGSTSVSSGNAVTHNGLVRSGNKVWFIGGRVGSHPGRVSSDVWIYNLDSRSWSRGPKLPVAGAAGGAALVNNKIHWFGGTDSNARCDVSNHFIYDLSQPSAGWQNITSVAAMPNARNHFSTVVHNGLIYAIGGQHGHDGCPGKGAVDVNLVHAFNPKTNKWSARARMPSAQSHTEASTFVYRDAIYVIGGEVNGNKVFRFDPKKNKWDTVLNLPSLIVAPVARVIDNQLIVSSGGSPSFRSPTNLTLTTSMQPLLIGGSTPPDVVDEPEVVIEEPEVIVEEPEVVVEMPEVVVDQPQVVVDAPVTNSAEKIVISLEAEYFDTRTGTATHEWVTNNLAGASNDASMITTPDYGALSTSSTDSPSLGYYAHFEYPGQWYLWVRGWGDTDSGEGKSDSLHAGSNSKLASTADKIQNFPSGWNWSNSTRDGARATINIPTSGIHLVNLWMREDGLSVDKIVLTNDPDYKPSGAGPVQSEGAASATTHPTCLSSDSDPDGDGWGWEKNASCKMGNTPTASTTADVLYCNSASSDTDGDGWGWENSKSCLVR